MKIVQVAILPRHADIEQTLDYYVHDGLDVRPGYRVSVPLGRRAVEGIVVSTDSHSSFANLKPVRSIVDSRAELTPELIELAHWLTKSACCALSTALSVMLPPPGSGQLPTLWQLTAYPSDHPLSEKQQLIIDFMNNRAPMTKTEIAKSLGLSLSPVETLIKKKFLVPVREPALEQNWNLDPVDQLTKEQIHCVNTICQETDSFSCQKTFLLHGVTGSGKTEVYIRLAKKVVASGRQVMILVPEIALTTQLVARFQTAFGRRVAILHSGLANNLRVMYWKQIRSGIVQIVIGTRSAVFAPVGNLGLVVLDEEHETAYKQEETPCYHARDVALWRAARHKAAVLLGSATPSLESWKKAGSTEYTLLQLQRRIFTPGVETALADMRRELASGNRSMFSRVLIDNLEQTLSRGEQAILFLNRRGLAPTVLCRKCGFRCTCPRCSLSMTLHQAKILSCHYCGHSSRLPDACPECGSNMLRQLGVGTQKLADELARLFPCHKVLRMDRDSVGTIAARESVLLDFYNQKAGILVGTQMIAKGLDFPNVTCVGIVLADLSLSVADFRAAERTFQLLVQAGGRSGRGLKPGKVVIQTYQPEHYSIQFALTGNFSEFAQRELKLRANAGMPPYTALTRVVVSALSQSELTGQVRVVNEALGAVGELIYSGVAPIEKIKDWWRWQFVLRHPGDGQTLAAIDDVRKNIPRQQNVRVVFDNNPYNLL
ncbi:MAG: primosomal protein N' [Firmicutes bacterium]|nr:primosomal protein N' [Bacillota bacterium]